MKQERYERGFHLILFSWNKTWMSVSIGDNSKHYTADTWKVKISKSLITTRYRI